MTNILIVDNNIQEIVKLKKIIITENKHVTIFEATNEIDALKISIENKIDIFFIEILLDNSCGLNLALKIRTYPIYKLSWILLTSSNTNYMLEAFKTIHCYDYILKPYKKSQLIEIINTLCYYNFKALNDSITLTIDKCIFKIYLKDIFFIEVYGRTCIIHTNSQKYTISNIALKNILSMINNFYFIKSHKSFVVNISNIDKIQNLSYKKSNIYFCGYKEIAPLSHSFKKKFYERINAIY